VGSFRNAERFGDLGYALEDFLDRRGRERQLARGEGAISTL